MSNIMFLNHSDCSCNSCSSLLKYFEISKCFGELTTEVQKALARRNLGIGDEWSLKWGNIKGFIEKLEDLTLYLNNYKSALDKKLDKHISDTNNPHNVTKTQVGLSNVTNDALVKRSEMGVAGGVATLNDEGKVLALLLPSDEEDVTVVDGKIKFKDRDNTNGMSYIILRKNKSFAEQVTKENTVYEIRYDFDLGESFHITFSSDNIISVDNIVCYYNTDIITIPANHTLLVPNGCVIYNSAKRYMAEGFLKVEDTPQSVYIGYYKTGEVDYYIVKNIEVPSGCELIFNGGSIKNASIVFNDTLLSGNIMFDNILGKGTISNELANPKWFGAKGNGIENDTRAVKTAVDVCNHVVFDDGTYLLSCGCFGGSLGYPSEDAEGIYIKRSDVILELRNAVLESDKFNTNETGQKFRNVITVSGAGMKDDVADFIYNIKIIGGKIIGSRSQFTIEKESSDTKENYCGIALAYVDGVEVVGTKLEDCTGDSIYTCAVNNSTFDGVSSKRCRRCGIAIGLNENTLICNCSFEGDGEYHLYENGNYSYGALPACPINSEPEPSAYIQKYLKPIKNITIKNCDFKMGAQNYAILGPGVGWNIEGNKFYGFTASKIYTIGFVQNYNNIHYTIDDIRINRNNVIDNREYETVTENINFVMLSNSIDTCNRIELCNNSVIGKTLAAVKSKEIIVKDNFVDSLNFIKPFSNGEGSKLLCEHNRGCCKHLLSGLESDAEIIFVDNQFDGTATGQDGNAVLLNGIDNCNVKFLRNNIKTPFSTLIFKSAIDKGLLLIQDNIVEFNGQALYWFNFDVSYVKADIIRNTFITKSNRTLIKGEFTDKMNVIGNVFGGKEIKFTSDETNTENLVFANNVYL